MNITKLVTAFAGMVILSLGCRQASAQNGRKITVACIGNSITYGSGLKDPKRHSYPGQLQVMLGDGYHVMNFGVPGTTILKNGDSPYWSTRQYKLALQSHPDIVLIMFGTNDSKAKNRIHLDDLKNDYLDFIRSFKQLNSHPRIILLLPIKCFKTDSGGIYDPIIVQSIIPRIEEAAFAENTEIIDLHALFSDKEQLLPDKIHPDQAGAGVIAKRLSGAIRIKGYIDYDIFGRIGFAYSITSFHGFQCANFKMNGADCKIVKPKKAVEGNPWIWRARFWGHEPQADVALLERGFHVVYCDVAELYGNKRARKRWDRYYSLLTAWGLNKKAALEGMSRGGTYVYNWAARNPAKVACVYADNPVLDLKSWPGGFGKSLGSKKDWILVKEDYRLRSEKQVKNFHASPIDEVDQIVRGKFPMLHLLADADEIVPPDENTIPFEKKVKMLGGRIQVFHKPGFKHHPHSLPDPSPIVAFILNAYGMHF